MEPESKIIKHDDDDNLINTNLIQTDNQRKENVIRGNDANQYQDCCSNLKQNEKVEENKLEQPSLKASLSLNENNYN